MILEKKVIAVCGAGPGLGSEVARVALRDGARVLLGARREERLDALAKELDPSGERVATAPVDVTDAARCRAFAEAARERFGGLDALVQVAALDTVFGGIGEVTADDWRKTVEVNLVGTTQMVQAVVPLLRERGGGSIVLIGSQSSLLPQVMQMAYAASKGALTTAMYYMARELGPDHIRVNSVVPTYMWGPPVEGYVNMQAQQQDVPPEEIVAGITKSMPLGEIPADEDVAEAVAFLCSDRARMITGQSLLVNAGELMR